MSISNITIVGNLGHDVEQKAKQDGTAFWSMSVANSETWKNKQSGEKESKTTWHKCVLYGNYGGLAPYLRQGTQVAVIGKQRNEKYGIKDKNGNPMNYPDGKPIMTTLPFIIVQTISLVGNKPDQQAPVQQQASVQQQQAPAQQQQNIPEGEDDLPF